MVKYSHVGGVLSGGGGGHNLRPFMNRDSTGKETINSFG